MADARLAEVQLIWLLIPIAYVIGSFPSARLIGWMVGIDPTKEGSRNPGATNMFRVAGIRAGAATLAFDVAKAFAITLVARLADGVTFAVMCGAAAVLGHMWPYLKLVKGGKGVACYFGMLAAAWPILIPVVLTSWFAGKKLTGHGFMGAVVTGPVSIIALLVIKRPAIEILIATALVIASLWRHRSNFSRLAIFNRQNRNTAE